MKFEKNNPRYEKALRTYFDKVLQNVPIQSICAVDDDGTILGGCGFSPVRNGRTSAFLLALNKRWATRETYAAIMRFPFEEMGAEFVDANVGSNVRSRNCCVKMGGCSSEDGCSFSFAKNETMRMAGRLYVE